MSNKNTGDALEKEVYASLIKLIKNGTFIVHHPYVYVEKHKKYYSKDRDDYITIDISVEKYLENPANDPHIKPAIIIIIECKDYKKSIPVDDVEEFFAKYQQIGAHKGIIFTRNGAFQKSAINYAKSKNIGLARIMPKDQVTFMMYKTISGLSRENNRLDALSKINYISNMEVFFCIDEFDGFSQFISHFLDF
jgi:hypothetical protein